MTDFLRSLFSVTFKRLWAQRGLAFAIELGLIAAVALIMLVPLYADAVNFRVLQTELSVESERQNRPPFVYLYHYVGAWAGSVQWEQAQALDAYLNGAGVKTLGLPSKAVIGYFETDLYRLFPTGETNYTETQSLGYFSFATATDIESQIEIMEGALPQPAASIADSPINVLIYQGMAEELGLQVGDAFTAYNHRDDGATLREIPLRVAGIWRPLNVDAEYWFVEPKFLDDVLLIPRETFVSRLSPFMDDEVHHAIWYLVMDGSNVDTSDVSQLIGRASLVQRRVDTILPGMNNSISPVDALQKYSESTGRLSVLLMVFNIPTLGLVFLFIILITGLAVDGRKNELAVMRSRGGTRWQMIGFSALEGIILGTAAFVIGALLALALTIVVGKARSFLDFSAPATLRLHLTPDSLWAGLMAIGLAILAQIIPVIAASRDTVISYKQEQARETKKPFWQRIWLDALLFIPSAYGFYILRQQGALLIPGVNETISTGDPFQNPLLFLLPAISALSLTLLFIRLFPYGMAGLSLLLALTDSLGILLATRQLARAPRHYTMPLILLVLTASLAVFTASLALTLDYHLFDASLYRVGADVRIIGPGVAYEQANVFGIPVAVDEPEVKEPNRAIFLPMSEYQDFPGVQAATRVGRYRAQASIGERDIQGIYLGVDRADFSQGAFWRSDFSIEHPAELMNALAHSPEAVLVSRAFVRENGLRVGDLFRLEVDLGDASAEQLTQIVGYFDYFPSWYPEEGPLFVGNLEALYTQAGGDFPYEVWLTTKGLPDVNALEDALTDRKLFTWRLEQPYTAIAAEQNRPERQGMFGLLSVGFISAALLTVLGFFIYARLSFRQRMVSLGILRAVGLSSRQMGIFLAFELAFLILTGLTLGTGLGALINSLYIPYLQVGNGNAIPPYLVEMGWRAVLQIYVLFVLLFVAALTALETQLRRMKIFEAIKLGETV